MNRSVLATLVSLWLVLGAAHREVSQESSEHTVDYRSPTFRPDAWELPGSDLLGFLEVSAGPFIMGEDADRHTVDLPRFFVGQFEVTVGQFRTFLDDTGHVPEGTRSVQGPSNHPVRHVSWHEAMAYAAWLTERLRYWSKTPRALAGLLRGTHGQPPWRITLPSEAEWEKAARGADARVYPWGNGRPTGDHANYPDAGFRTTAAVGSFPEGQSPYGVQDMSGNVWEWTRSLYRDYPYDPGDGRESTRVWGLRVLRGGSFLYRPHNLRGTVRVGDVPGIRMSDYGFRLVITGRP